MQPSLPTVGMACLPPTTTTNALNDGCYFEALHLLVLELHD